MNTGNLLKHTLLEIKDWLLYCMRHGWTSYRDYQTLMWEMECQREKYPPIIRGIDC
jgi:hypothetical protein